MTLLELVALADRIGIMAFAVSGVLVGVRRRLDLYGLLALGLATATGGGIIRDLLLGEVPRTLERADYLLFAAGATVAAIAGSALVRRGSVAALGDGGPARPLRRSLRLAYAMADAVGTGAFAVTGALLGHQAGLALPAALVLAVVTATGGGVIRDVLANRIPLVLRTELNATAALVGGAAAFLLVDQSPELAVAVGFASAAALSLLGRVSAVNVPRLGRGP